MKNVKNKDVLPNTSSQKEEITEHNIRLKQFLLEKGYFVHGIGIGDAIDYLVVTCAEPKDIMGKTN